MAHPHLQTIRERYAYRCGYCGVSEVDAGGELTVNHFSPSSAGGADDDSNLVYACVRCNQYKGALLPIPTAPALERRILHPLHDDLSEHLQEDETTGTLAGLTATGRFHIQALRLNRPALVAHRLRRRFADLLETRLRQTLAENADLREGILWRERYIASLEERVDKFSQDGE